MEKEEEEEINKAMVAFMRKHMKWTHRELHDAHLAAGVAAPVIPSMRNYVAALCAQYGNADTGFLPQLLHTHTKAKLRDILRILSRTGVKLRGTLNDQKGVLAERLAHCMNRVLDAGRRKPGSPNDEEVLDDNVFDSRPPGALACPRGAYPPYRRSPSKCCSHSGAS